MHHISDPIKIFTKQLKSIQILNMRTVSTVYFFKSFQSRLEHRKVFKTFLVLCNDHGNQLHVKFWNNQFYSITALHERWFVKYNLLSFKAINVLIKRFL